MHKKPTCPDNSQLNTHTMILLNSMGHRHLRAAFRRVLHIGQVDEWEKARQSSLTHHREEILKLWEAFHSRQSRPFVHHICRLQHLKAKPQLPSLDMYRALNLSQHESSQTAFAQFFTFQISTPSNRSVSPQSFEQMTTLSSLLRLAAAKLLSLSLQFVD
jgi:hypothetical protein